MCHNLQLMYWIIGLQRIFVFEQVFCCVKGSWRTKKQILVLNYRQKKTRCYCTRKDTAIFMLRVFLGGELFQYFTNTKGESTVWWISYKYRKFQNDYRRQGMLFMDNCSVVYCHDEPDCSDYKCKEHETEDRTITNYPCSSRLIAEILTRQVMKISREMFTSFS